MTHRGCSLGYKGGCHLQSFALLLLNACETVLGSLASLGVGHAENIVSFDSAVNTAVAWDWLSEHKALRLLFDTIKGSNSLIVGLVHVSTGGLLVGRLGSWVFNLWVVNTEECSN